MATVAKTMVVATDVKTMIVATAVKMTKIVATRLKVAATVV